MITPEKVIEDSLRYLEGVYNRDRAPNTPEWEEIKHRVENRLRYVLRGPERGVS